jgi:hypothetical protein
MVLRFTPTRAALFPAAVDLIHGRPGAALGLAASDAAFFVTFLDVFRFALLLVRIFGFASSWHGISPLLRDFMQSSRQTRRKGTSVEAAVPGGFSVAWQKCRRGRRPLQHGPSRLRMRPKASGFRIGVLKHVLKHTLQLAIFRRL